MSYAEGTGVPVERSKSELDRILGKYGASQRMIGSDDDQGIAIAAFQIAGRQVRMKVPIPMPSEFFPEKDKEPRGWHGWTPEKRLAWVTKLHEQTERERWRCLVLLVKAKLELVELGISSVEREFLADIRLPNGKTVYELLQSQIKDSYTNNKMPPLLGAAK